MTEYEKLTVVKLREELVKRGLAKTGLKASLIQRLVESDAQSEQATSVAPADADSEHGVTEEPVETLEISAQETQPTATVSDSQNAPRDNTLSKSEPKEKTQQDLLPAPVTESGDTVRSGEDFKPLEAGLTSTDAPSEAEAHAPTQDDRDSPAIQKATDLDEPILVPDQDVTDATRDDTQLTLTRSETEAASQDLPVTSTQNSVIDGAELKEDRNKRKRRSQSPPPSSFETAQKRAKADNGRPHVKLPEDEASIDRSEQSASTSQDATVGLTPTNLHSEGAVIAKQINGIPEQDMDRLPSVVSQAETSAETLKDSPTRSTTAVPGLSEPSQEDQDLALPSSAAMQKASPTDTRFKSLFTSSAKREGSPTRALPLADHEDRLVAPALHPATCALYIRDFMRPLNPGSLKDYLIALASPPDTDPKPAVITEFFLDSIRTHCLVGFVNTAAASRVRFGLHDRVWPDEKNRKPLWVDFVPEEKLKTWIEVESEAAGDRRQSIKKWEVIYEEEKEGVTAYLQEAGLNSVPPRAVQPRAESGTVVQGAHTGPRGRLPDARAGDTGPTATLEGGKAFGALDDLFPSTTAKPKLYYLPVPRDVANRRLDGLRAGRGGGRGDEMRRYTFEEGTLVDKGPEFGARGRGGYGGGGRGGAHSGYPSRGGGYRGDTWRGRR